MNALRFCTRSLLREQRLSILNYTGRRCIGRWVAPTLREIVKRKKKEGPKPEPQRNTFLEWNQDAELYAFNARLREQFDFDLLLQAFTFRSYLLQEEQKQRDVGIENPKLDLQENTQLIEEGQILTEKIIKAYLCNALPRAPEECIYTLLDYLMSVNVCANASLHIGTKELILSDEDPISNETLTCTFYALVAALSRSPNVDFVRTSNFVRDFLIACLADKDLTELWCPDEPEKCLNDILLRENREIAEPRLIAQAGVNSHLAVYQVAFYSNREFLGKAFGETVDEARNVAAIDSLNRMFGLGDSRKPINYQMIIESTTDIRTENLPITNWCSENINKLLRQ